MESNELAGALLFQVVRLEALVTGTMRGGLEKFDLTGPLAKLLLIINPAADPVPLRKLAVALQYDPSNVTLLCAKLEEKGLAERRPHPRDGRIRTLVVTDAGRVVRDRMLAWVTARSPLSVLSDAEQHQLHAMLAKALAAA